MNWTTVRLVTYVLCLGATALSAMGIAEFNPMTGDFLLHPVNLYEVAGPLAGIVSSTLASVALWKRWGK